VSQSWRFLSLGVVMPSDAAQAFVEAAQRAYDVTVQTDGRRALLWVWRGTRDGVGSRRLGAAWVRHGVPDPTHATIEQIAWDPQVGSEPMLWSRLERLAAGRLGSVGASAAS
jgi:hypothetical protein